MSLSLPSAFRISGRTATFEGMTPPDDTPHYHGHRQRLRQRFLEGGDQALPDYELLELILFLAIPRTDTKPLAKQLLARFGGFAAVLNADIAALTEIDGIKENAAATLKLVEAAARRLAKTEIFDRPVINSWEKLVDYCRVNLAHLPRERLHLLFLDRRNAVIAGETQGIGTVDHAPIYPREVARRALELNATAVIMVHNHPSGDPSPSAADIEATRKVAEALKSIGVTLHDHLIVGRTGHASLRSAGLMG
jgi:DNA repair protein RadC